MRSVLAITAVLLLTGCATRYMHTSITDPGQQARQLDIDTGECTMVSSGAVPRPQPRSAPIPIPTTARSSTSQVEGSFSDGTRYTGTVRTTQQTDYAAQGLAIGQSIGGGGGGVIQYQRDRDAIFHGCMVSRGWMKDSGQMR